MSCSHSQVSTSALCSKSVCCVQYGGSWSKIVSKCNAPCKVYGQVSIITFYIERYPSYICNKYHSIALCSYHLFVTDNTLYEGVFVPFIDHCVLFCACWDEPELAPDLQVDRVFNVTCVWYTTDQRACHTYVCCWYGRLFAPCSFFGCVPFCKQFCPKPTSVENKTSMDAVDTWEDRLRRWQER